MIMKPPEHCGKFMELKCCSEGAVRLLFQCSVCGFIKEFVRNE